MERKLGMFSVTHKSITDHAKNQSDCKICYHAPWEKKKFILLDFLVCIITK